MIWKLKQGVRWHDGKPFTADDVVFTWAYAADLATAAYTTGSYQNITVEKIDDHAVKVTFKAPTPFWADPFVGAVGQILPKHYFGDYAGAKSRDAPGNLKPVGTGPYKFVEFKPGDLVRAERNADYHVKNQPYFDTFEIKGGGDAVSAARAVLQTGEYDYAWNLLVEDEILKRMEAGGKGKVEFTTSGGVEFIILNTTDPWTEVDGERSGAKDKAPDAVRSGGATGAQPADRSRRDPEIHLRPRRCRDRELRQPAPAVQVEQADLRVQCRQGQQDP